MMKRTPALSLIRRRLIQAAIAVCIPAWLGAPSDFTVRATAAEPVATIVETKTISQQPRYYHGWPTLARRQDGTLIVVCSGGRHGHVCPFGRVEMMVSRDDGKSWTWPRTILDTDLDDRDAGVLETAKGTLLVTTFTPWPMKPNSIC
jgi:sialidase-1